MGELKSEFDLIDGVRVCKLRPSMLVRPKPFGWIKIAGLVTMMFTLAASIDLAVREAVSGNHAPKWALLALASVWMVYAIVALVRPIVGNWILRATKFVDRVGTRLRQQFSNLPTRALLCRVGVRHAHQGLSSVGYLWFDRGWAHFRGDQFDFDLSSKDVHWISHQKRVCLVGEPFGAEQPVMMTLSTAEIRMGANKELERGISQFKGVKAKSGDSLWPPLKPASARWNPTKVLVLSFALWLTLAFLVVRRPSWGLESNPTFDVVILAITFAIVVPGPLWLTHALARWARSFLVKRESALSSAYREQVAEGHR